MATRPRQSTPTVIVIDDDQGVREALHGLFQSVGLAAETYGSVREFLDSKSPDRPGCMVVDIRLPGQSGLDFQDALATAGENRPIILISGHADVPMSVRAMKAGAVAVLTKPVREQELLDAVQSAIAQDGERRAEARIRDQLEAKFARLSERERQVMALVTAGMQNKQVAAEMSITEATVKLHRGQVMRKLGADSLVDLVRMADRLNQATSKTSRS